MEGYDQTQARLLMNAFLAYSLDSNVRYKATSGGVGTTLLKYLFERGVIHSAISFDFNREKFEYVPKVIHSFEEYELVGSIYHEINLVSFVREHAAEIKGGFACFCLPCQSKAIRRVVEGLDQRCILLGLTCSSQQRKEATLYLLKRLNIEQKDVRQLQYRGNGWPSGVQIELFSGQTILVRNGDSIWTDIFHSRLFIPYRCFMCENTLNSDSDISIADPWLKSLQDDIGHGKTLILVNTDVGQKLWLAVQKICVSRKVAEDEAISSQISTIKRKLFYKHHPFKRKCLITLNRSSVYKGIVTRFKSLFRLHGIIRMLLEREYLWKF